MAFERLVPIAVAAATAIVLSACSALESRNDRSGAVGAARPSVEPSAASSPGEEKRQRDRLPRGVLEPPAWLGKRVLPQGPHGFGVVRPTPPVLRDRRFATVDHLPPPSGSRFVAAVRPVPKRVLERSTWSRDCPVDPEDLSYVTVTFWGFDRRPHTGELLVNSAVARDVLSVFEKLFEVRWPIEEMRITTMAELDAPPTGDGNNTTGFVCRPSRSSPEWSEHALGLAIDINPFHNPYVREPVVLPERAVAYRNRGWRRPGMIHPDDAVTRAFDRIGWLWGGDWSSSKDWMHFSASGR